jgi:hypothetical protein
LKSCSFLFGKRILRVPLILHLKSFHEASQTPCGIDESAKPSGLALLSFCKEEAMMRRTFQNLK